jgi:biofilm protein TabA
MILDRLANSAQYCTVHPGFAAAFEYLRSTDFSTFKAGRHEVDGERMFVVINRESGRGRHGAKFESHRRYIDIQLTIGGTDEMAWRALETCSQPVGPFNDQKDIVFYQDAAETWLTVPPQTFAVFFPQDVHAPLGGTGELFKAVMKVAVDWK